MTNFSTSGTIVRNETHAGTARVRFKKSIDGEDSLCIDDGVMYLYLNGNCARIASDFDIKFEH